MAKQKKTCCRSTPRCASCPVLIARARRPAQPRAAPTASLFAEIFGGGQPALPDSVSQALAALALAREPRRAALRRDARRDGGGEAPGREFLVG